MKFTFMKLVITCLLLCASFLSFAELPESLADVKNLRMPNENHYASGQPQDQHFAIFSELGVKHVINLRSDREVEDSNEATITQELGLQYHHVPIAGAAGLTRGNVELFDQALSQTNNESTLIHCASSNRAGALMALRAVWIQNKNLDDALSIGRAYGMTSLDEKVKAVVNGE